MSMSPENNFMGKSSQIISPSYWFSLVLEDIDYFLKLQCGESFISPPLPPQLLQLLEVCGDDGFHEELWQSCGHIHHRISNHYPAPPVDDFPVF